MRHWITAFCLLMFKLSTPPVVMCCCLSRKNEHLKPCTQEGKRGGEKMWYDGGVNGFIVSYCTEIIAFQGILRFWGDGGG